MINVFVEGSSWPAVAQELRKMLGDEPTVVEAKSADYEELEALHRQLDAAAARYGELDDHCSDLTVEKSNLEAEMAAMKDKVDELKTLLDDRDARIAELEEQVGVKSVETSRLLDTVEAYSKTIADLENQLADAKAPKQAEPTEGDTEEQAEIPEVTQAPIKEYKKEEVRAVLCQCRAANIPISDILAPYGGSLGAVKPEDYAKLMEDAEAALAMAERSK